MVDRWPHVQMIVHVRQNYFLSRLPKEIRESVMANGTSRLIEQLRVNEIVAVRKNQKTTKSSPLMHLLCLCFRICISKAWWTTFWRCVQPKLGCLVVSLHHELTALSVLLCR